MKKLLFFLAILAFSGCSISNSRPIVEYKSYDSTSSLPIIYDNNHMTFSSIDFNNGDFLPLDMTCDGKGEPPILQINHLPTSTVVLAVVVDDPDAPAGVFTHWLAWNIDRSTTTIDFKDLPADTTVGINSGGSAKYVPPCPPSGLHHYYFRLYALDKKLDLSGKANVKILLHAMTGHIIDEAVLMGVFQRNK